MVWISLTVLSVIENRQAWICEAVESEGWLDEGDVVIEHHDRDDGVDDANRQLLALSVEGEEVAGLMSHPESDLGGHRWQSLHHGRSVARIIADGPHRQAVGQGRDFDHDGSFPSAREQQPPVIPPMRRWAALVASEITASSLL